MNKRGEIVNAVYDRLSSVTAMPVIYKDRYLAIKTLPAIIIYALGDNGEKSRDEQANIRNERIVINVYDSGLEEHEELESHEVSVSDKLNAIVKLIEGEFNKSYETLDGLIHRLNYVSTDLPIKTEGGKIIGTAIVTYTAVYIEQLER